MPIRRIRYSQYAIVMLILAVLSALFLPTLVGTSTLMSAHIKNMTMTIFGIAAVMVVYTDDRMIKQALYQQKQLRVVTLWLPILGQTIWYLAVLWIYLTNMTGYTVLTMTLPILFLGMALLLISLGALQKETLSIILNAPMKRTAHRLNITTMFLAIYALLFFGLTTNWIYGLTTMASVLLITDANWPALWSGWHREQSLEKLATNGVNFKNARVIEKLPQVTTIITEKSGILTDNHMTVHSILSLDKRYSDFDILGIATGLLSMNETSALSKSILQYAENHGVFPSTASEPEIIDGAGIKGVILNESFAVLSAAEVVAEGYDVDLNALETYKMLGNSVSYVVDSLQVIGVITFGDTLNKALLSLDRFFTTRHLGVKIASGDTIGATMQLSNIMTSLDEVKSDLTPAEKTVQQEQWTSQTNTMFVTNQDNLPTQTDTITVAVDRPDINADIHVANVADLEKLWATADRLIQIDKRMLSLASLPIIILLLLAAGLGIFISPWLYVAPVLAVIIRCVMSYLLRLRVKR